MSAVLNALGMVGAERVWLKSKVTVAVVPSVSVHMLVDLEQERTFTHGVAGGGGCVSHCQIPSRVMEQREHQPQAAGCQRGAAGEPVSYSL